MAELIDLWSLLPDGEERATAFLDAFEADPGAHVGDEEVREGMDIVLRLTPGGLAVAALTDARAAVESLRGAT